MALCNNQEEIAEALFYEVDWQSPCTLMNDWEIAGEIDTCGNCGKLFMAYNVENARIVELLWIRDRIDCQFCPFCCMERLEVD